MAAQVHIVLAAFQLAADAEIFDGAANDAHRMAFETGQADQHVRCCNRLGNVGFF